MWSSIGGNILNKTMDKRNKEEVEDSKKNEKFYKFYNKALSFNVQMH